MKTQRFTGIVLALWGAFALAPAFAAEPTADNATTGFYGGVSLGKGAGEGTGLNVGQAASSWARFNAPANDDTATRSLVFGGYRWSNDIAVEAAFNSSDKYSLRTSDSALRSSGVGLTMAPVAAGLADVHSRTWNVDVYTSWAFYKSFALYGRLGLGQAEAAPLFAGASLTSGADPRRLRDNVNYGVGLRYDMSRSLGLRVEYARFGRYAVDPQSVLPDSDQLTFGLQYRF